MSVIVRISGTAGSGKSTVATLVATELAKHGFSVEFDDDTPPVPGDVLQQRIGGLPDDMRRATVQTVALQPRPSFFVLEGELDAVKLRYDLPHHPETERWDEI